ncbi:tryptophan--tRNA ligase [Coemansia sp. RSA 2711]|nr:tryptophan--tRNA ligase [Coemansia sp. RSA 2711]KAJ1844352.1 tryptophan--tRNA ligase [Coemansia sp. RSA 2708]KAJ2311231.1 tryptophan--tRNA ligase [Coemansia sp. RSA 2704]KAJ2718167.1 tryptophan--tRNA ligase [Coemansia sp. Cherry 401B]
MTGSNDTAAPVAEVQNLSVDDAAQNVTQNVTPWDVEGAVVDGKPQPINYDNLVKNFGTRVIDAALLERFEKVTGHRPHKLLRRGVVFSHRDLGQILDRHEQGKPFYLYTGRGPSSGNMHIGHMLPLTFCKWLQDVFDVPLVIQLTDDEKFLFKPKLTIDEVYENAAKAVLELAAIGFRPEKTFIFSDLDFMGGMFYRNILAISRSITFNQAKATFGFDNSTQIGRINFPSVQIAPAFCSTFPEIFGARKDIPCLIPCAIDQDPYFRLARDVALPLKHKKPALIHSKFLSALQGTTSKMSSSVDSPAIFMNDTPAQIKNKINRHAFSGGQTSLEEHRKYGGNPDVDVPYQYLTYFLDDDDEIAALADGYRKGEITTGEMKARCIKVLQEFIGEIQERSKTITDQLLKDLRDPSFPRKFASLEKK